MPVAWNMKHSNSFSIRARIWVMQGVVTPNMVRPTPGLSAFPFFTEFSAMPAAAWAALAITLREMALSPATSTTAYIMAMSDGPT